MMYDTEGGFECLEDDVFAQLRQLDATVQEDNEQRRQAAFQVEARPVPDGLIVSGTPLGHIAFMGDFEQPSSSTPG